MCIIHIFCQLDFSLQAYIAKMKNILGVLQGDIIINIYRGMLAQDNKLVVAKHAHLSKTADKIILQMISRICTLLSSSIMKNVVFIPI